MSGTKHKYPGLHPHPPEFAAEYAPVAKVVEEECIACDRCIPLCFFDALVMDLRPGHPYGRVAAVAEDKCTGCGLCFEACPVDAFTWVPDKRLRPYGTASRNERERSQDHESY